MRDLVDGFWPYKGHLSLFRESVLEGGDDDEYYDYQYNDNWNYQEGSTHPLADIPFCYIMKTLYYESGLNLQDIIDIDNIRISLEVDYQFFVEYGVPQLENFDTNETKANS